MPYILNRYDGTELTILEDGTVNTVASSINLIGRNYYGYGEKQNENFVYLLENFAGSEPPLHPIKGQVWFDSGTAENTVNLLKVYDGTAWNVIGSAVVSETAPETGNVGAFWLKSTANTLHVYNGTDWSFIGPETAEGFGTTKAESTVLVDTVNVSHPVILFKANDVVVAIAAESTFTLNPSVNPVSGFTELIPGITISSAMKFKGDLLGNADRASRLETTRLINGVGFNGQNDITIRASTTNKLTPGTYILGDEFDGASPETWTVDATSANTASKIVARDAQGNFSANTITANIQGDLRGNVTVTEGTSYFNVCYANSFIGATLSGNAETATRLQTPRKINGVLFSGVEDITVTAEASTLTGTSLSSGVTQSNLSKVGQLTDLSVNDTGISVGTGSPKLKLSTINSIPSVNSLTGTLKVGSTISPEFSFLSASAAASAGGVSKSALAPETNSGANLGLSTRKFDRVYANDFMGTSTNAINLMGGAANRIPYQTAANTTGFIAAGSPGDVLLVNTDNTIGWSSLGTSLNVPNQVVIRNADGDFAARNLLGNASTATKLQTARKINGVNFDGTQDITVSDPNSGTPIGAILHFPVSNLPVGWVVCDGASYSTSLYPLLFEKIGYLYGGSGGVFRVPDLRGEFIRGADLGRGVDIGRSIGSFQADQFKSHTHTLYGNDRGTSSAQLFAPGLYQDDAERAANDPNSIQYTGGTETRPRNIALVACIKVFGTVDDPDQVLASNVVTRVNGLTTEVDQLAAQIQGITNLTVTYGNTVYSTAGYSNIVGSFSNSANYFDVFPPSGKTMSNLVAFVPSIAVIHYAGGVNGDDSMRCTWSSLSDRIRVYVQNTEQRSTPAANYMAVWR